MTQTAVQPEIPTLTPHEGWSEKYAFGWEGAEDWLRNGGMPDVDSLPPDWDPEEAAGFRDRLAKARNPEGGKILTFRPRKSAG